MTSTYAQTHARRQNARGAAHGGDQEIADQDQESTAGTSVAVLSPIQVGRADDPAEAAADRVADSVLGRLAPLTPASATAPGTVARRDGVSGHATAGTATIGPEGGSLDASTGRALERARAGGSRIPTPILDRMEAGFGRSFDSVRIHDDHRAGALAGTMSAQAFTTGSDIFLSADAPRAAEPGGERLLAHELAHVVQGGAGAHREPDDEKSRRKAEKAERKRQKEAQKQHDKDVKAQTKQTVKESKAALKDEKKRLGEERKIGVAKRAEMAADITGERTTVPGQQDADGNPLEVKSGNNKQAMDRRFKDNLDYEQRLFRTYRSRMTIEQAAAAAYDVAWMNADEDLRAVRPPRETEAERLVSEVKHARGEAAVRESMNEQAKRGTLLSKTVEEHYERFEAKIAAGIKAGKTKEQAEVSAQFEVWAKAKPEVLGERPKPGSAVDLQAREDARRRLAVMPDTDKKDSGLDEAEEMGETVEGVYGKAEKVLGVVEWATKVGGAKQTASMRESYGEDQGWGDDKARMVQEGLTSPEGGETKIPILGEPIEAFEQAKLQTSTGVKTIPPGAVPTSTTTKVSEGFGAVTEMLSGLIGGVNGAIQFAKAVKKAHSTGNPRDILAATKVGADALAQFNSSAKSASSFATVLNPDVTVAVAHAVPGFDIMAASLGIISGTMSMVETGMRVQDTQVALNSAHAAKVGNAPNVLVYPLLRVEQSYVKNMELNTWNTVKAVSDLAASIAQLASAGGYGIPAAYKAATNLLTLLHKVGQIIADDALTLLAKQAQRDAVAVLEGAAENQLQRDPAMAVDGIIMSAVKGDQIAETFLSNYAVGDKPVDRAMLSKLNADPAKPGDETLLISIRSSVLKSMGNDANPTYTYQKYKESIGGVLGGIKKHTIDKFADTGKIAEGRNAQDQGDRGIGWRMKMMFTSEKKIARAKNRLAVEQKRGSGPGLPDNVECRCGDAELQSNASDAAQKVFMVKLDAMDDATLLKAANDPANPPDWQTFFFAVLHDRAVHKAKAGAHG